MTPNSAGAEHDNGHIVIVLGMHRSGTSTAARALQALGVSLGENLHPAAVDNPKGFWEDRDCLEINEALLAHLGSSYASLDFPGKIFLADPVISDLHLKAAEILRRKLSLGRNLWGFKDPRTCRLLAFWRPVMAAAGYKVTIILAIRNPISVAASLQRRDQIPLEKGYLLWLQHVVPSVLSSAGTASCIVVDYDRMMDGPLVELARMAQAAGLPLDVSEAQVIEFTRDFLDHSLRHTQFPVEELSIGTDIPSFIGVSYRLLLDVAKDLVSINSDDVQGHFLNMANLLEDMRPAFSYVNKLELERDSLRETASHRLQVIMRMEDAAQAAKQQLALHRDRTEIAEQHQAAEQRRAEAAEERSEYSRAVAKTHEAMVKTLEAMVKAIEDERDDAVRRLTVRLTSIEESTSWRLTAPLRAMLDPRQRRRLIRRWGRILWWSMTLRLPRKRREGHANSQTNEIVPEPAPELAEAVAPVAEIPTESDLPEVTEHEPNNIWFDPLWYSAQDGASSEDDFNHFITEGAAAGRYPSALVQHIMQTLAPGDHFTLQIYENLAEASALWQIEIPPDSLWLLTHLFVPEWHSDDLPPLEKFIFYLSHGLLAGVVPGPFFDAEIYRNRAFVAGLPPLESDGNALLHWLLHGQEARVVPTDRFDEAFYRKIYPDIDLPSIWGFAHYIQNGIYEERLPRALHAFSRSYIAAPSGKGKPNIYRGLHAIDFPDRQAPSEDHIAQYDWMLSDLLRSEQFIEAVADAQSIDPGVGDISTITEFFLPPFHDSMPLLHAELRRRIPEAHYDTVLCVPWIRTGGADLVAGLLAEALLRIRPAERILILRTDHPHFERANWLPAAADTADISDLTMNLPPSAAEELLRVAFRGVTARRVFNVNSRLCWTTLRNLGANLAATLRIYAYMFCWDQKSSGLRAGYPSEFFAETFNHVTAFLTDTAYLRNALIEMYQLAASVQDRILPLFTPAQKPVLTPSISRIVFEAAKPESRRLVLWAGRLDRQKRFDLVQEIARRMPDIEFRCWGNAVLDAPPDLSALPRNIIMQGEFDSFDDLPLSESGVWLYTALWEGMPTTLIELAMRGVPVVASAVGGIPELLSEDSGWPVSASADPDGYVNAIRDALSSPEEAMRRAETLQRRVAGVHSKAAYDAMLEALLSREDIHDSER